MSAPTFASNKDRLVYLLAEFKWLVIGLIIGLVALVAYYQPAAPELPDWIPAILAGWVLLGLPCYLVGLKIARWLRDRMRVEVHHVNAVDDVIEKHYVPPQIWQEKTIPDEAPDPYPVNGGSAWAVREYEWLDDVGELRVEGVWLEGCRDTELMTAKKQMDDIHGWLIDRAEELAAIRGRWSRGAVQLQKSMITADSESYERGQMLQKTAAKDTFGDLIEDGEDYDDAPSVHDLDDAPDQSANAGLGHEMDEPQTPSQETMTDD